SWWRRRRGCGRWRRRTRTSRCIRLRSTSGSTSADTSCRGWGMPATRSSARPAAAGPDALLRECARFEPGRLDGRGVAAAFVAGEADQRNFRVVGEEEVDVALELVRQERGLLVDQELGAAVVSHGDGQVHPGAAGDEVGTEDDTPV